ncbi:MAG: nitronate monooxygenase [Gammaproteobacteria bacterium]|nr:nitronate monooxygenase [Gammaproteobacteria bacterium]
MWPRSDLTDLLGIDHPIIQAPMSGSDSPALAAAVSNAGGVGSLGCGEMSLEKLREAFGETRSSTTRPFMINFFAHDPPVYPSDDAATMRKHLAAYYEELGLGQALTLSASPMRSFDAATLQAVLELQPQIVSFHFGLPTEEMLDALKSTGSIILCSATTVSEARQLEAGGVHAIIAQGCDAGGHRGTFSKPLEAGNVGTFSLVPQVVDAVSVPVIAAGGIADGRGIAAAFALGASGVQMGTAFLLCPESAASPIHREVLQQARDDGTILTRAFTGRPARAFVNRFTEEMASQDREVAAFPLQDSLTLPLHIKSVEQGSKDFAALFSGQASSLSRTLPAGELVDALVAEAQEILAR